MAQRGFVTCLAGLVAAMPIALIPDTPAQAVGAVTSVAPTSFTNRTTTSGLGNNSLKGVYATDDTIYAATDGGGLSISTNGGTSFTTRTTADGLGDSSVQGVFAVGSTVYAATGGGLSISTDGGTSFTNRTTSSGLGRDFTYGVYAPDDTIYAATFGGLSISTDGGTSFTNRTTSNGLGNNIVRGVYATDDTIYAATTGGLSISTVGGTSFINRTTTNGLGSNLVLGVYASGSTVYAATSIGLAISTDGGTSFSNNTTADGLGNNTVRGVYAIGSTVYVATFGGGLSISTDGGATWSIRTTADGLGSNDVLGVYVVGSTVYAATTNGLSISLPPPPAIVPVTLTCDGEVKFYANIDDTIVFDIAPPCILASDSLDGIWNNIDETTGYLSRAGDAGDWWAYAPEFPVTATLLESIDYNAVTYHLEVGDVAANVMVNDWYGYDLVWMGPPTDRPGPLTFSPDTASPAVTAFDDTPVVGGTPATQAVTVRNTGDDTATPTAITASGTGVSVTGNTCSAMAPGATCTVNLEWAPTAAGALTGSVLQISYDGGRDDSTTLTGTATAAPSPSPSPTNPPGAPASVTAIPGNASAAVSWTAPADTGSYPISTYQVTATPGGRSCMTSALTCEVSGLTNGATYTFTVKALNGAGWSPASSPSNSVTPQADPKPSILISGSRTGSTIRVDGTTTDLTGTVTPWIKLPGQTSFTEGSTRPTITDNAFTWSRKANKKAHVYITHGAVKSNTITIAAR